MTEKYFIDAMDEMFKPPHEPDKDIPDDDKEYFTEEDYKELNRNIILYKEGNREAITYIIHMFHPFITKYVCFIKYGNLPHTAIIGRDNKKHYKVSPTIASFVSLYTDKDAYKKQRKSARFSSTCFKIKSLFERYEYGDIYNELVLALLNMARKYKVLDENDKYYKENGTFHMYVSKCFHFEAFRFLDKLVKDPITHFDVVSLREQFSDFESDNRIGAETFTEDIEASQSFDNIINNVSRQNNIDNANTFTLKEKEELSVYDDEALNFNWTNGVTCSEIFETLTPYERELIVLTFIQKKKDEEIARIYGCHRVTISIHRKKAVAKIRAAAEKANVINKSI